MQSSGFLRKLSFPFLALPLLGLNVNTYPESSNLNALRARLLGQYETVMEGVVDGSLAYIKGRSRSLDSTSTKTPQQSCLRGVKKGLMSGGVFKRYPAWHLATQMVGILNNNQKNKVFIKDDFKFIRLPYVQDVESAPAYSIIIYGGKGQGHIELKVPAQHLIDKGFTFALKSIHGKSVRVPLTELKYVYISDYIDAFPRNHPSSRIANRSPDNERPLKAVFEVRKI